MHYGGDHMKQSVIRWEENKEIDRNDIDTTKDLFEQIIEDRREAKNHDVLPLFNDGMIKVQLTDGTGKIVEGDIYLVSGWSLKNEDDGLFKLHYIMYDINDFDFQKDTIIETPLQLSKFLYNKVKRKGFKQVLDIGSHKGNLSKYFKNVVGLDIEDTYKDNFKNRIYMSFEYGIRPNLRRKALP